MLSYIVTQKQEKINQASDILEIIFKEKIS